MKSKNQSSCHSKAIWKWSVSMRRPPRRRNSGSLSSDPLKVLPIKWQKKLQKNIWSWICCRIRWFKGHRPRSCPSTGHFPPNKRCTRIGLQLALHQVHLRRSNCRWWTHPYTRLQIRSIAQRHLWIFTTSNLPTQLWITRQISAW